MATEGGREIQRLRSRIGAILLVLDSRTIARRIPIAPSPALASPSR